MNMMQAVNSVFSNYANFSGRARRSEYWFFVLFNLIAPVAMGAVLAFFGRSEQTIARMAEVYSLVAFVPGLAVVWRRLHDIGKSGACCFWILFPIAGPIIFLVWMCREGTRGPNRFGPDPKGPYAGQPGREPWET